MSPADDLAAVRVEFMGKVPPESAAAMTRADMSVAAGGIAEAAIKAGQTTPAADLPESGGAQVRLADLMAQRPVVASFCRGGWRLNHARVSHALPDRNGPEKWVLPVPATFVIASDGTWAQAPVEAQPRIGPKPGDIIKTREPLI